MRLPATDNNNVYVCVCVQRMRGLYSVNKALGKPGGVLGHVEATARRAMETIERK